MTATLEPYPDYKPSGVEWIGDVPAHWGVRRLENWLGVNELTLSEDTDPEYTFDYVDIGAVETGRLIRKPERMRFGRSPSRARRVVRLGDTIVSTVRTYLKAVWYAERQHPGTDLEAGPEALNFVSLFDDTADVWADEDFLLVEPLSTVFSHGSLLSTMKRKLEDRITYC